MTCDDAQIWERKRKMMQQLNELHYAEITRKCIWLFQARAQFLQLPHSDNEKRHALVILSASEGSHDKNVINVYDTDL